MGAKEFEIIGNKISDILNDINNVSLQLHVKERIESHGQSIPCVPPTYFLRESR